MPEADHQARRRIIDVHSLKGPWPIERDRRRFAPRERTRVARYYDNQRNGVHNEANGVICFERDDRELQHVWRGGGMGCERYSSCRLPCSLRGSMAILFLFLRSQEPTD